MKMQRTGVQFVIILSLLLLVACAGLFGPDLKPALALSAEGQYAAALEHYQGIIKEGKANARVYRLAYEAAFLADQRKTAAVYYQKALENGFEADSMNTLAVQLWYGWALRVMASDKWAEAQEAAEEIGRLAPESREDKFCRLVLAGKRKYDRGAHKGLWDALNDYTKASILDPATGLPHYLMGQARYKNDRNNYDDALKDYYESLRLEPNGLFADQARADIRKIESTKAKMKAFWGK